MIPYISVKLIVDNILSVFAAEVVLRHALMNNANTSRFNLK